MNWYRPRTFTRSNAEEIAACEGRIADLRDSIKQFERRLDECRSSPDDALWAGGWFRFQSAEFGTVPEGRVGGLGVRLTEEE